MSDEQAVDPVAIATQIMEEAHEGYNVIAFLRTGVTATNRAASGYDHFMALVEQLDHVRLLSYPSHPVTGRRMDVSFVPIDLARHVVAVGHENEPMRYRFLDHLRSAEVLTDRDGLAAGLADAARKMVSTGVLQGDYVHSQSAFIEDLWGELDRGNPSGAWTICRDVATGALGMLMEEQTGDVAMRTEFANMARQQGEAFADLFESFFVVPDDARDLVAAMLDIVATRENQEFDHSVQYGQTEQKLLGEVKQLAEDLVRRHGDDIRAVGATGSIGRNSVTADADYDVHVLIRPRHPDDAHRIDFRLYTPNYPGLPRRAELGFTPTTFMQTLLSNGLHEQFSYYHLDHVSNTALVYDPAGEGAEVNQRARLMRPDDGVISESVSQLRAVLDREAELTGPARADFLFWIADEVARMLLMRYGLAFMKPKYRALTLDRIRDREPEFFAAYDRLKGLDGLSHEAAQAAAVRATHLFDLTMEKLGTGYRYRCEEMQLA